MYSNIKVTVLYILPSPNSDQLHIQNQQTKHHKMPPNRLPHRADHKTLKYPSAWLKCRAMAVFRSVVCAEVDFEQIGPVL